MPVACQCGACVGDGVRQRSMARQRWTLSWEARQRTGCAVSCARSSCSADVQRRAAVVRACGQQWLRKLKLPPKLQAVNPFSIFCDWQTQPRVPSAATPAPRDSSLCAPERRVRYGAARRASVLRFSGVRCARQPCELRDLRTKTHQAFNKSEKQRAAIFKSTARRE
jgi:hypothetical protein